MNLIVALIIGWTKAGIIAWAVWFLMALAYTLYNIPIMDLATGKVTIWAERKEQNGKIGQKSPVRRIAKYVIWPWGIVEDSINMMNIVKWYNKER